MYLQLVINPGSTSTKLAIYADDKKLVQENISHDSNELAAYKNLIDQLPFRMEMLCDRVGLSESQTIRLFKKAYGKTPYAYLFERRVWLARHLLRETSLSVSQIAEKLAFSDEYYFSGLFKKKTGVSPSAYRSEKSERKD